jgi:hypothetical protein
MFIARRRIMPASSVGAASAAQPDAALKKQENKSFRINNGISCFIPLFACKARRRTPTELATNIGAEL